MADFAAVFESLKPALAGCAKKLAVKLDAPGEYFLETKSPSPFKQHKGHPLAFAAVRVGKAYVSFHLVPLYMCPNLNAGLSPELKRRMQGKACFNFKTVPQKVLLSDLKAAAQACLDDWAARKWL